MSKNTGDGELDEIILAVRNYYSGLRNSKNLPIPCMTDVEAKTELEHLIAQEANKAQQELLQELMEQMPDDTIVATKYGYHSREKKYGFRMGMHEAQSVIQNKLEGLS